MRREVVKGGGSTPRPTFVYTMFICIHRSAVYMEKQNEEFWKAYRVVMREIDNRPNTRPLFHKLVELALTILEEEEG